MTEGDLIRVIQPDGQQDTYRLTAPTPAADGYGVSFTTELVDPPARPCGRECDC